MIVVGILLLSSFIVMPASGEPTSGNILYVGGSGPGNYSSIQDAINAASDGDTVYVYSGTYYENVNVHKTINLIGENKETTVIDGGGNGNVVDISAVEVKINGFTLQNGDPWGIKISDSYNNIISGNKLSNNNGSGIYVDKSSNNDINYNTIENNKEAGISLWCPYNNVNENIITNNSMGIYLFDSSNNNIYENTITNNKEGGIYLLGSFNNTIYRNNITNNSKGIEQFLSLNSSISENTITNNREDGVHIDCSGDNKVINNRIIHNNGNGIYLGFLSSGNKIIRNIIANNNDFGIYLKYSSGNQINSNNFIDNGKAASFYGSWRNRWKKNYWDRPRLFPKPIFGRMGNKGLIPWVNFDWRPARKPYDLP